jgi:hypothetical protein
MPARNCPTCHHLFPDHHRCGPPSLRGEAFCYFHHPDRQPAANPYARRARRGFRLDPPTNRRSLQNAIAEVIARLAANQLDVHRAQLLLHSLDIASRTLW